MHRDVDILRALADRYAQAAWEIEQAGTWQLHADLNDLHPQRPIVLINELPWHELNGSGELTLECEDPDFRRAEEFLRRSLFQYRYFPGDMLLRPYFPVQKTIRSSGNGVSVKEETRASATGGSIVAHRYENQFHSVEDVEKLHYDVITYDWEDSMRRYEKICAALGDVLPVRLVGEATGYGLGYKVWDLIATYMSVDELLYALIDEPEMMHALAEKLTDIFLDTVRQYEEQGLIDEDDPYCHCSSAISRDLRKEPLDRRAVRAKNVWGRGLAQILATVSPAMHDEFEIAYARRAMEPFGLVYYGCCEPLDTKIDEVRKIPHLRKISITPWADINRAAEAIGRDFVISAKPNPANLPFTCEDPDRIRKELRALVEACRRNNTPCELLLKDISTAGGKLENLVLWNRIAQEEALR